MKLIYNGVHIFCTDVPAEVRRQGYPGIEEE
jgi:hypothetical protein